MEFACGGQRTTFRSCFSPANMWTLGIELRSSNLAADTIGHSLSHLTVPKSLHLLLSYCFGASFRQQGQRYSETKVNTCQFQWQRGTMCEQSFHQRSRGHTLRKAMPWVTSTRKQITFMRQLLTSHRQLCLQWHGGNKQVALEVAIT